MVRTTSYSLPSNLHDHVDVVQPTTMFGRFKGSESTISWPEESEITNLENLPPIVDKVSGALVDASCNTTITITCLQQLYNAVGFTPSSKRNSVGITGYLEQFANIQDLQSFYADQRPDALNSSFNFISVKGSFMSFTKCIENLQWLLIGGLNNQTLSEAGAEANLDVQFAFGLSHPIPVCRLVHTHLLITNWPTGNFLFHCRSSSFHPRHQNANRY